MSQRDQALTLIREVILAGLVPAGERTSERQLTEGFLAGRGLGRTPIREALAILTQLGLVEQYPQSGFAVRVVDEAEATSALTLQRLNERLIVSEAARRRIDVGTLRSICLKMELAARDNDCPKLLEFERGFHMEVARRAGYASAVDAIGGFRDRVAMFLAATRALDREEMDGVTRFCKQLTKAIEDDSSGGEAQRILDAWIGFESQIVDGSAQRVPERIASTV